MTVREQEVMAEIQRILAEELKFAGDVSKADRLANCDVLDSLGAITLAVGLEDRFRIKLSAQHAPSLLTFDDVIQLVNRVREKEGR